MTELWRDPGRAVTADIASPRAEPTDRSREVRSADRFRLALGAIVIVQAIWLGALMSRGWYYQADFSNLAQATGRPLSWSYLTMSQGGHFALPDRFTFWVLNRTMTLNYPATIAVRLVVQAVATVLLARLLTLVVGRRVGVLVVLTLYALSPLMVQGTLWLTSSIGLLGSQVFLLIGLISHVRYAITRQLRWALATAAAMIVAVLVSEQAAVTILILPLLSVGFLHDGTVLQRVRSTIGCWREWVLIAAPMLAIVGYFFFGSADYDSAAHRVSVGDAWALIRSTWASAIAPSLTGAQTHWFNTPNSYFGFAFPSLTVRIASLVAVAIAVAIGVRRIGPRALLAWSAPAIVPAVGIVIVAVGRFDAYGMIIAHRMEYAFFTAVPATIAVCLSFWFSGSEDIRSRLLADSHDADSPAQEQHRRARRRGHSLLPAIGVAVAVAVAAGSIASGVAYTRQWANNPARSYVDNLTASARLGSATVTLFDTPINPVIVPVLEPARHISDLTPLAGIHARFDQGSPAPKLVSANGRIVPAVFLESAHVAITGNNKLCNNLISKVVDRTEVLTSRPHRNEWFLRLSYFQQHPSVIYVSLIDTTGKEVDPVGGARVVLVPTLGATYLRFPTASPVSVRIRSTSASTNLCLAGAQVGFPFPVAK
jgi:hypothetical protein